MRSMTLALALVVLGCTSSVNSQVSDANEAAPRLSAKRPIPAYDSVWIERLTYLEVRDRIANGTTTAIIATGGIEENGPYLATGKHNVILNALCPAIATELGNALCAPVVKFVPQGDIDPPTQAMRFPGTFSLKEETYRALLEDIASSLKQHGFSDIVLIGDSGGNQKGMQKVADTLNRQWQHEEHRVHFIKEFYSPGWEATERYTEEALGVTETKKDGHHDDIWVTAMMAVTDPQSIRHTERVAAGLASINGVDISDLERTQALGKKMVAFRAQLTAAAIRAAIKQERLKDPLP